MKKRGVVEVQFNWILILVAGALIFAFFFGIIQWAIKGADTAGSVTVAKNLDAILTGAFVTKQTISEITLPFDEIVLTCDDYGVDGSKQRQSIRNKIIFAPRKIEGGQIITWSLAWSAPFRVTNFLFVTSPRIRYIIVTDGGDTVSDSFDDFPEEFTSYSMGTTDPLPTNQNHDKVRFVYVNTADPKTDTTLSIHPDGFSSMGDQDVTAVWIQGTDFESEISLKFYKKSSGGWSEIGSTTTLGKAGIIGSVFAEDPEDFDCAMDNALDRLKTVAQVYQTRSEQIGSDLASPCSTHHSNAADQELVNIVGAADLLAVVNQISELSALNDLAQKDSCPLIY